MADADRLCVETQDADLGSTLAFSRALLALRARIDALQGGAQRSVDAAPGLFCFVREDGGERLLVALNFTSEEKPLDLREQLPAGSATIELSTSNERALGPVELDSLALEPDEGLVITLANAE